MSTQLAVTRSGHIASITINNPPANTWTLTMLHDLHSIVDELNQDQAIQALVLRGAGEKFFSAGADLKVFAEADQGQAWEMAVAFGESFEALSSFRGVSIAAINGYAMGGGLEVALACDIRLCVSSAKMALPEGKVGLLPCAGGTQNLTAAVGEAWAKRIILCGEMVDAATAQRIGLVEEVLDSQQALFDKAEALAGDVANQSPTSLLYCKQLIQMGRHKPRWQALIDERELFIKLWRDGNRKEGCSAFLEKRKPVWSNS